MDIHYLYEFLPCPTFLIYMLCLREIELFLRKHKNNQLGYSTILPLSCFDNQLGHCSLIPSPSQTTKLNICLCVCKVIFSHRILSLPSWLNSGLHLYYTHKVPLSAPCWKFVSKVSPSLFIFTISYAKKIYILLGIFLYINFLFGGVAKHANNQVGHSPHIIKKGVI